MFGEAGNIQWCSEPHRPGHIGEAHFDCDLCGRTGHVSNMFIDAEGRRVNATHLYCLDLIADPGIARSLQTSWGFEAANSNRTALGNGGRPWESED